MAKQEKFDFTTVIANVDKVKAAKAAKEKKPSTSVKPLQFDTDPDDSPLKAAIIERINARDLTYSDIYAYCTEIKGGDIAEGQKLGYNIISGLKNRHTMIDTTFSMLCDFLKLEVRLVPMATEDDEDDEDGE
jgi:hypothetical protein